jgi:predicted transcriptional regulator
LQLELLELLFLSEKREQLLLYLKDGPKNIDEIKEALQANATTILPQIKKLKEKSLIIQKDKTYTLSIVGEILVEKMQPLINVINVFEDNFGYWAEKDLHGIPPGFRKRIGELGKCKLIQPDLDRMFEIDQEIVENLFRSKFVFECVSYFHSPLISLCQELARKGVEFKILTS